MSKKKKIILAVVILFVIGGIGAILEEEKVKPTGTTNTELISEQNTNQNVEEKLSFKEECEQNAIGHPAKMGAILYTKGEHKFTGMKYYFKGEILKFEVIESNVGNPSIWLVKNENGYVMPIQHDRYEAKVGDTIEVWGTLTGNGYAKVKGIDNVVGQTGSMHAIQVTVNGEMQY